MNDKDFVSIQKTLTMLGVKVDSIQATLNEVKEESSQVHVDHEHRITELELSRAKLDTYLSALPNTEKQVDDTTRAIASLRKFFWTLATGVGVAVALALIDLIIERGKGL